MLESIFWVAVTAVVLLGLAVAVVAVVKLVGIAVHWMDDVGFGV